MPISWAEHSKQKSGMAQRCIRPAQRRLISGIRQHRFRNWRMPAAQRKIRPLRMTGLGGCGKAASRLKQQITPINILLTIKCRRRQTHAVPAPITAITIAACLRVSATPQAVPAQPRQIRSRLNTMNQASAPKWMTAPASWIMCIIHSDA